MVRDKKLTWKLERGLNLVEGSRHENSFGAPLLEIPKFQLERTLDNLM